MRYLFTTTAQVSEQYSRRYWIDNKIVPQTTISAKTLKEAIAQYVEFAMNKSYLDITKSAVKRKSKMYCDTRQGPIQTGYVITAHADIDGKNIPCELWVEIQEVNYPKF